MVIAEPLSGGIGDVLQTSLHNRPVERRIALIIANSSYSYLPGLSNPSTDAALIAAQLRLVGFDAVDVLPDATNSVLRDAIIKFAERCRLVDSAIIYYAGHGFELSGRNYVVPVDARIETPLQIGLEAIPTDWLTFSLNNSCGLKLLILDACRSVPSLDGNSEALATGLRTGLAPIQPAGNVIVSYSAAVGHAAEEGKVGEASPFALALAKHAASPGIDVRQILGRVRDEVLRLTDNRQCPFVYSSSGGDPIYLAPPTEVERGQTTSAIDVDLTLADSNDEAVRREIAESNEHSTIAYSMDRSSQNGKTDIEILPELGYFRNYRRYKRPVIFADMHGFFSEDSATWGSGFPTLDILIRAATQTTVVLSEILLEVRSSIVNSSPYVDVRSISNEFCTLALTNEGWCSLKESRLDYEIVGFGRPEWSRVREILNSRQAGGYRYSIAIPAFEKHHLLSLTHGVSQALPDFKEYEFTFKNIGRGWDASLGNLGSLAAYLKSLQPADDLPNPENYESWLASKFDERSIFDLGHQDGGRLWIVGQLTTTPASDDAQPIRAAVIAPLAVLPPWGLGGGSIGFNLHRPFQLRSQDENYMLRRGLGYLLDRDTTTFRGLFTLSVDKTSYHYFRVVVRGNGGRTLYESDWITLHAIVPRTSMP
jgi:Caspase domain